MSYITLNKNNFFHNLDICSKQATDKSKIAIVLKDNAYGHGLIQIATLANEYGITKAVVRTIEEAKKIEKFFKQILILADTTNESLSHTFHITINRLEDMDILAPDTNIHIKIDTGMHRNGIDKEQLRMSINRAFQKKLNICGFFTHHKSADKMGTEYFIQKQTFKEIKSHLCDICEKLNLHKIQLHSCNSAALFRTNNFTEDFARIGIAAYGYIDRDKEFDSLDLKPVLSLYAHKNSSRKVKKYETVGYGGTHRLQKDSIISNYDIGYADGFHRIPDGMIYNIDKECEIIGRISMDNMSINSDKEEICVFDDVKNLAQLHKTISYEMLTSLKDYIKRIIV